LIKCGECPLAPTARANAAIAFWNASTTHILPALLEGFLGSKRWIAAQIGKIGGSVSSKAKTEAARRNGKLGGRPKIKEAA